METLDFLFLSINFTCHLDSISSLFHIFYLNFNNKEVYKMDILFWVVVICLPLITINQLVSLVLNLNKADEWVMPEFFPG